MATARASRVLVAACGSIGVVSLPHYLIVLGRTLATAEIRVVMSATAQDFIPAGTIRHFAPATAAVDGDHIRLGGWADLVAVLPATADVLARTAAGNGDTPVSLLILAHAHPVIFFPNMNRTMWRNPAVHRNVATVRELGHVVVEPVEQASFEAATGETTIGCVTPGPEDVARILRDTLADRNPGA